jgi:NADH:ubiquinone oxidoreductase subunit
MQICGQAASTGRAMSIFSEIFSWWGGNTWSLRLTTMWRGRLVGTDEAGNRYYVQNRGVGPLGVPRRWVVYANGAEASQITADWHGWMHYTVDTPPTAETYAAKPWQKPHRPNMTGTADAYRPAGSILGAGARPKATGDYAAWKPD